ncbi:MAG: RNA polymerase sigma factor [Akkermansiaceae bacterium]|nr:RNA polymerase sigma factor [Akkermansiaceae bacterium]
MEELPVIDENLLAQVRAGTESAWQDLVKQLSPQVFGIIRNQIRVTSDHDDIAQEAFTKIFLKLDQFAGKQPFRNWVSRLTINTCYDWLRKRKARPLVSYSDLGETEAEILEKTLAGDPLEQKENIASMRALLDRLISSLKPREQIVIRLLDLEEKSVQDVGELTGWGASKIKVTAMRARKKLRDLLNKLESDH